jgi:hypothetical protein
MQYILPYSSIHSLQKTVYGLNKHLVRRNFTFMVHAVHLSDRYDGHLSIRKDLDKFIRKKHSTTADNVNRKSVWTGF